MIMNKTKNVKKNIEEFVNFIKDTKENVLIHKIGGLTVLYCVKLSLPETEDWVKLITLSMDTDTLNIADYRKRDAGYAQVSTGLLISPSSEIVMDILGQSFSEWVNEEENLSYRISYKTTKEQMLEDISKTIREKFNKKKNKPKGEVGYNADVIIESNYLSGTKPKFNYEFTVGDYKELLDYISNKEKFLEKYEKKFLTEEKTLNSYANFIATEKFVLKGLENFDNPDLKNIKEMRASLKDAKTVKVVVKKECILEDMSNLKEDKNITLKDGKTIHFITQVDTHHIHILESGNSWISTWNFLDVKSRNKFEKLFGRGADIRAREIIKLIYNGKTVWEKGE